MIRKAVIALGCGFLLASGLMATAGEIVKAQVAVKGDRLAINVEPAGLFQKSAGVVFTTIERRDPGANSSTLVRQPSGA